MRALDDAIFDIDVHRIPARGREPAHLHFDVRFLVQAEHDRFRVSDESQALAWVPAVGLDSLTNEESVLRMARKWVTQRADGRCDASASSLAPRARQGARDRRPERTGALKNMAYPLRGFQRRIGGPTGTNL